jgi:hypothetical protein
LTNLSFFSFLFVIYWKPIDEYSAKPLIMV